MYGCTLNVTHLIYFFMALYPLVFKDKCVFYFNLVSATLWTSCFLRFLILLPLVGRAFLPGGIADFFHVVLALPLLGFIVVNIAKKASSASLWGLLNGLRMVWICYGVIFPHPKIAKHWSYSLLILAWCIQYIIDSSYYAFKVKTRTSPQFLFWLHHHHYCVTFPLAFASELILVFLGLAFVEIKWHEIVLQACMLAYVPIGYFTFQHLQNRQEQKYDLFMEKRKQGRVGAPKITETAPL